MAQYTQNFETLVQGEVVVNEASTLKLKLDKNKSNDKLKLHIREYVTTPEYTGFSGKNGLSITVEDPEQIATLQKEFATFLSGVANELSK